MINVKYYEQRSAYDADESKLILPNLSLCKDTGEVLYNPKPKPHDYSQDYLTFVAEEGGTFKFSGNSVNYSVDNGATWTTLANNTNTPTISAGNKIMFKATLTPASWVGIGTFSSTGRFTAQGNVMSLLYGDNFIGQTSLSGKDYAFYELFSNCTGLTSAENMSLPATTLAEACYFNMFYGCTSLTTAPELPATTLAGGCYGAMFSGCTSLTTAPSVLPATTLENSCYSNMFNGCTSLTTAPVLPATALELYSCSYMFSGCTNLNSITCLATRISASNCTFLWVKGVASTGTFYKNPNMTGWTAGIDGIPSGWAGEYYQP
jgi:hypothetical protein